MKLKRWLLREQWAKRDQLKLAFEGLQSQLADVS
jgi:hypothetical protein